MKKIYIVILLLLSSCIKEENQLEIFEKELIDFKSYNSLYLEDYYLTFLSSNNLIYSLNKINYPFFYYEKSDKYIYDGIFLINKQHKIPLDLELNLIPVSNIPYIKRPNEIMKLNKYALEQYKLMIADAKKQNIELVLYSGYRSYEKQASLWDTPYDETNMYKAIPGYSEHHTGLALDISSYETGISVKKSKTFDYLRDNAHRFGFILRYPENKEEITGYNYEPWHYRYVGDIATYIYENNLTLEEYIYNFIEIY